METCYAVPYFEQLMLELCRMFTSTSLLFSNKLQIQRMFKFNCYSLLHWLVHVLSYINQ